MTPEEVAEIRAWWESTGLLPKLQDPKAAAKIAHILLGATRADEPEEAA